MTISGISEMSSFSSSTDEYYQLLDILTKYGNNAEGIPALLSASKNGDLPAVQLLIKHGADPFTKDSGDGQFTALHYALLSKNHKLLVYLLDKGLDPNECGRHGVPVWNKAIELNDVQSFQLLVSFGLRLDSMFYANHNCANWGYVPALQCIQNGSLDLLKFILSNGGDLPMEYLGENGLLAPVSSNWPTDRGKQKIECAKWLAAIGSLDLKSLTKLDINNSHPEFIEYLLENKFLSTNQKYNETPLIVLTACNPSLIRTLIKYGADVNLKGGPNSYGSSALHYASDLEIIKLLIEHGADVNALDSLGRTPLFVHRNNAAVKALLIAHGAILKSPK